MSNNYDRSLKKNAIQLKIGFIMLLAVVLLTATCYLLYRNLSSIVSSMPINSNPERRLLSIRDIAMDLEKAGNSVRIYTITRNSSDIKPYYNVISNIDEKVNRLNFECRDDSVLLAQTDTISLLIEENIYIWTQLLVLYNDNQVVDYLKQLSDQLSVVSESNQKKEKGILRRVFSRNPKTTIDEKEIMNDLNKVVEQNRSTKDEVLTQESLLADNSSEIKEKLYDLITKMENEMYELINKKAETASEVAGKSYLWLIMLSISGGLLAILVLYIIIRYARNAYSYQLALENSKDEAEKLASTKELFMANMSHEIRTPVTAISGFTDQLLHEPLTENISGSLKIIKSSSDHLLKIIDDILDFSKLQNKKLVLEKVNFSISQVMEEVYGLFERQAGQNNTRLSYSLSTDTPPVLVGDPYRLKQIIINLVSNSVKFTKDGTVHFEASFNKKNKEEVELILEVTDTGIGIEESKIDRIFDDFTQAEMSTTRKYGGTGLGLSIVKKLIELQNGTIDLKSKLNQGTKIVCRIPFMTGHGKQLTKDSAVNVLIPEEFLKLKILIVDDEEYNRLLFKKILDRWKINCKTAENGMEAFEILKEEKFDLLFMDMRMPGIDGLKTTLFIRNEMKISESDMKVVFMSAAPLNDDLEKYKKAGMSAFLQKPFTEEILLATFMKVRTDTKFTMPFTPTDNHRIQENSGSINLNNLYHISDGDEQFVKQMLISFINTTGKLLAEMQEALNSGQMESVADLAHKILPPCRHLGAMDLYNNLGKIEKTIRNNDMSESVEILTEKLLDEFRRVSELLNAHIAKMN